MARKTFKFVITGVSKKTGEIEEFVSNTRTEIRKDIKPLLTDVKVKEGSFVIRRRKLK